MFRALIQVGQLDWMGGQFGEDWQSPVNPDPQRDNRLRAWALREQARGRRSGPFSNIGEETANARVYAGAVDMATEAEMALAAAHGRLASAFSAEVMAKPEEGLIDAAGVVNMENANKALYEQAQAAGATAAQLAMLGVATGQFTEEQAQAALKAAILQERIKQIAAGVASGELSYSDAAGGLASFGEALNAGAIGDAAGGIEALSTAATDFANSSYEAELSVEDQAALTAINDVAAALGGITGTHYIHLVTTTNDGTPSTDAPGRIGVERNAYTVDTRQSGFVGGGGATRMLEWQGDGGGSGAADNRTAYNVTVNNYIDGQKTSNRQLEDITPTSYGRRSTPWGCGDEYHQRRDDGLWSARDGAGVRDAVRAQRLRHVLLRLLVLHLPQRAAGGPVGARAADGAVSRHAFIRRRGD